MNALKQLRRMSPPAYAPIRENKKTQGTLRIHHTVEVVGHGTVEQEAQAYLAWRKR